MNRKYFPHDFLLPRCQIFGWCGAAPRIRGGPLGFHLWTVDMLFRHLLTAFLCCSVSLRRWRTPSFLLAFFHPNSPQALPSLVSILFHAQTKLFKQSPPLVLTSRPPTSFWGQISAPLVLPSFPWTVHETDYRCPTPQNLRWLAGFLRSKQLNMFGQMARFKSPTTPGIQWLRLQS